MFLMQRKVIVLLAMSEMGIRNHMLLGGGVIFLSVLKMRKNKVHPQRLYSRSMPKYWYRSCICVCLARGNEYGVVHLSKANYDD